MLAYLFLSEVASLTQSIHSQTYLYVCISVLQLVRNIAIAVFADIAAFGMATFTGIAVFASH